MGWLIALGILILLAALPLGITARYDESGAVIKAIAGSVRICLYPRKAKIGKKKGQTASKPENQPELEQDQQKREKKSGGSWKAFVPFVRIGLDFLGDFRRKLRVNRLEMKLILAGSDPADLGILYGNAWAALGNLWPQLERVFVIKKRDVGVECDFTSDQTRIFARLDLTITLGRLLVLTVRYGIRTFKEYWKIKNKGKGGAAL